MSVHGIDIFRLAKRFHLSKSAIPREQNAHERSLYTFTINLESLHAPEKIAIFLKNCRTHEICSN